MKPFANALLNNQIDSRRVLSQHCVDVKDASPESIEQAWALLQMHGCDCYRVNITNLMDGNQATRVSGFVTEEVSP